MKNWATLLFGIIGAAGASMQLSDNPTVKIIGGVCVALGIGGVGVVAKDANVTGVGKDAQTLDNKGNVKP